eukprot:CAMPEP_0176377534 /NCGR_PEP_ID=MMETSP0126-20121128/28960_1 /TAXON_ID=141414 ORGANISM="Strombidinopsis acuminatum, Strain SPMC142" /NCGR_SAMPLE_ID=MMETSP0126 /ASSEMBLY_ACC=CAM_ASM_000229 /LENGTH=75 /DNA_ID=CAMNT_0017739419 /DNA_START=442 /DNA_END=668 /DNA_ORIENTATION=+
MKTIMKVMKTTVKVMKNRNLLKPEFYAEVDVAYDSNGSVESTNLAQTEFKAEVSENLQAQKEEIEQDLEDALETI